MAFSQIGLVVARLPRLSKRLIVMTVDAALCAVAVYLALYLRLGEVPPVSASWWGLIGGSIVLALPIFSAFGLYRAIFRQAGLAAAGTIARACAVYGIVYAALFTFGGFAGIPRTAGVIQPILLLLLIAASRVFARFWLGGRLDNLLSRKMVPRVLIYGAGATGRQLRAALEHSDEMTVVGYLDDNPDLHRATTDGIRIHDPARIAALVERLGVSEVLLAVTSATQQRRSAIIADMQAIPVRVRTLPNISDMAHGRVAVSDLRELEIEDLLGRKAVEPDPSLLAKNIRDKIVLVTGAGGSIGSELCRQILNAGPQTMLLIDHSEFSLYAIHRELLHRATDAADGKRSEIVPLLASVTNEARLREIMLTWQPDTIYHAAAYKHVPLVEHNPCEGIANNVFGTLTVARIAIEAGVSDVVLISTDKAVRPTNVMGTTKRVAELVLQSLNADQSIVRFSMVRFGNVLGSSGSVVPLFRQQIRDGGPVTVTDLRITRYFMTIPEAAELVIQAGAMAEGGEVFVLDMGEPVRVAALARTMIELSGRTVMDDENPDGDIAIAEVGLRPGEKLYEELLIGGNPTATGHQRILKANEAFLDWPILSEHLIALKSASDSSDIGGAIAMLRTLVPEFAPERAVTADWVSMRREQAVPMSATR